MDVSPETNGTLQTERVIPFAADTIYNAFADASLLAKWWGPAGFTNTFEVFEFKAGGLWKFVMHGPDGQDYLNESLFTELVPSEKVVIHHYLEPDFVLEVSLVPAENNTRVIWRQTFKDPAVAEAFRRIAQPGNEQNLDRLTSVLNELS